MAKMPQSGPNILVIVLGADRGRWHPELTGKADACLAARAASSQAMLNRDGHPGDPPRQTEGVQALGLAVLKSWKYVNQGHAASVDTFHLMAAASACAAHSKRGQPHFFEH